MPHMVERLFNLGRRLKLYRGQTGAQCEGNKRIEDCAIFGMKGWKCGRGDTRLKCVPDAVES